jgi:hypothetical protein
MLPSVCHGSVFPFPNVRGRRFFYPLSLRARVYQRARTVVIRQFECFRGHTLCAYHTSYRSIVALFTSAGTMTSHVSAAARNPMPTSTSGLEGKSVA